jgi:hypothetical protein
LQKKLSDRAQNETGEQLLGNISHFSRPASITATPADDAE